MVKNVAIGTGVILICVTISAVTAGAGIPAASLIFLVAAKGSATYAATSGVISAVSTGVITGLQTGDFNESLKAAALAGSESYKWGAIIGAVSSGTQELVTIARSVKHGLTMNQAAVLLKEGLPSNIVSLIRSPEEGAIYLEQAGLRVGTVNGEFALIRDIDLTYESQLAGKTVTNLERMLMGKPPIDPASGLPYELHHIGQEVDSALAILTKVEHTGGGNYTILHEMGKEGVQNALSDGVWTAQREAFWKGFVKALGY